MRLRYCHYAIGLLLSMGLIPVLRGLHLPIQFDWMHLGIAFWIILTAQSIFVTALLYLIAARSRRKPSKNPSRHKPWTDGIMSRLSVFPPTTSSPFLACISLSR
jgi:hypothetical protein